MISMPLIEQLFQRITMDVVGPLPRTQGGNRFIWTICDYATRYPEAFPLLSVEAPRVAKELIKMFSHVGIPDEILTDQGTNFMSTMIEEIYCLVIEKVSHATSSLNSHDKFLFLPPTWHLKFVIDYTHLPCDFVWSCPLELKSVGSNRK